MAQKNSIDNLMMTFADLSASNKGKNKSIIGLVLKAESTLRFKMGRMCRAIRRYTESATKGLPV